MLTVHKHSDWGGPKGYTWISACVQSSCKEEEGEDQVTMNVCGLSEDIRRICINYKGHFQKGAAQYEIA